MNSANGMICSFGTTWRGEEQIIALTCSTFRERWCCHVRLHCLPGDGKCKVIGKKGKSASTSLSTFSCHVIWKPPAKRRMSGMRFPDVHHNESGAYWYFHSMLRLRGTESWAASESIPRAHSGFAFYSVSLPVLTVAMVAGGEQRERAWDCRKSKEALVICIQLQLLLIIFLTAWKLLNPSELHL